MRQRLVGVVLGSIAIALLSAAGLGVGEARAASCQCFEALSGTQSSVPLPIVGNSTCGVVTSITDCTPQHFNLESEKVVSGYGTVPSGALTYYRSCQSFRDNSCQTPVGQYDPSSKFNPCWTQNQCDEVGGEWDSTGKDSPQCNTTSVPQTARCFVKTPPIKLQIPIPGLGDTVQGGFPGYMAAFYKFFVALLAVASVVMVMWGGFKRIIAVGNPEKIKDANDAIAGAITGLVLVLVSYSLLALLNPRLVTSTRLNVDKVKTQISGDWCPPTDAAGNTIQCGDRATINGTNCIGRICLTANTGCYKVGASSSTESTGKLNDYQCLTRQGACEAITLSVAKNVYGDDGGAYGTPDNTCKQLSQGDNICAWGQEYGVVYKSTCRWITPADVTARCASVATCSDLNSTFSIGTTVLQGLGAVFGGKAFTSVTAGRDYAFCNRDLCKKSCKAVRYELSVTGIGVGGVWHCE